MLAKRTEQEPFEMFLEMNFETKETAAQLIHFDLLDLFSGIFWATVVNAHLNAP